MHHRHGNRPRIGWPRDRPLNTSGPHADWPRHRIDAAIAIALFVAAFAVGVSYTRAFERTGTPPEPWVKEMSAAIAFACGHGYVDPGYTASPAFEAFLDKKIDALTCDAIPPGTPFAEPNFTQRLYRYMTLAVGLVWRLFGISWTGLSLLFGLLYGVSAAALYGLFRLVSGRGLAIASALVMVASPLQLKYLPQLRDYAKAPFILTLILILGALVFRPFSRRRLIAFAAAYGAVMGVGFGFRNDLLINVLPFVVTIAFFLPVPVRSHVTAKFAAVLLGSVTFLVCSWPIIRGYQAGSNTGHVAVLGLMAHFDEALGIAPSVYDWGRPYDDGFVDKVIGSFAERIYRQDIVTLSPDYDRMAIRYLLVIARNWPADMLTRAYASVLRVVELPFQIRSYATAMPPALQSAGIATLYSMWDTVLSRLAGTGVAVVALAIAGIAGARVRAGVWALLSLLYFAGYPALQFDARHFFFLEFIPWLAILLIARWAVVVIGEIRRAGDFRRWMSPLIPHARRAVVFTIVAVAVLGAATATLRAYQTRHLTRLLDGYIEAPTERLTLDSIPTGDRHVLLRPHELTYATGAKVRVEYIGVDVSPRSCGRLVVPVTFRYETKDGYTDLSQRIYVTASAEAGPTQLFAPVFFSPGSSFSGIETSDGAATCVTAARRVTDLRRTPVLLNLMLPPDWHRTPLYQMLARWEQPHADYRVTVYAWPRNLDISRLKLTATPPPEPSSHARIVSFDDHQWVTNGLSRVSTAIIIHLPERKVVEHTCFFLRGTLYRGGFTFGVLKNNLWSTTVNVNVPGEFLAIVEVPREGRYAPAVGNFLTGLNPWNEFVVTSGGWVERDSP